MARFYVTHDGPHDLAPLTRSGSYRVFDELQLEPIREFHWYESRGIALPRPDKTLSEADARKGAYDLVRQINSEIESVDAYRRRK